MNPEIEESLNKLNETVSKLIGTRFGNFIATEVCLTILNTLEEATLSLDEDPSIRLIHTLNVGEQFANRALEMGDFLALSDSEKEQSRALEQDTMRLFEEAWTVYDPSTYDHSVKVMEDRLLANGYDADFFKGKTCFDGGCGTGRFAVAMARLGAEKVVAVDFGGQSLEFARKIAKDNGYDAVEYVEQDVTDLSRWDDASFDFVASQGVLHHTVEQERGIAEHFRITKPDGIFWIYLYGKGGYYWPVYDSLKATLSKVGFEEFKKVASLVGVRQGIVYTFLDNFFAPIRTYYSISDVKEILDPLGAKSYEYLKGVSTVDDTPLTLESKYGKDMFGPEGEIRLKITR